MKKVLQTIGAVLLTIIWLPICLLRDAGVVLLVTLTVLVEVALCLSLIGIPMCWRLRDAFPWFENPFVEAQWLLI